VEEAALSWFSDMAMLSYRAGHCAGSIGGRAPEFADVILVGRLKVALRKLNPNIPQKHWMMLFVKSR